jgi:hypothetical protein
MTSCIDSFEDKDSFVYNFLTEKSNLDPDDELIKSIAKSALKNFSLLNALKERHEKGIRFIGWTTDGSKGYTEVETGNIKIGKSGHEAITLGYECINSRNKKKYKNIGLKYAFEETNLQNREGFAKEVIALEAEAMYQKCKLAVELEKEDFVKNHYLKIYKLNGASTKEKIEKLKVTMISRGLVHFKIPAFNFYKNQRYNEFMVYYRKLITLGKYI